MDRFTMKRLLFYGDLCTILGYGDRIWEVIGYSREYSVINRSITEEIMYSVVCISTGEWAAGIQEEAQLICRADESVAYIQKLKPEDMYTHDFSSSSLSLEELFFSKDAIELIERVTGMDNPTIKEEVAEEEELYVYPDTLDGNLEKLYDLLAYQEETKEDMSEKTDAVKARLVQITSKTN